MTRYKKKRKETNVRIREPVNCLSKQTKKTLSKPGSRDAGYLRCRYENLSKARSAKMAQIEILFVQEHGYGTFPIRNDDSSREREREIEHRDARGHVLESLLLFPLGSPRIQDAANAPVQKGISIRLESNVVPPMSPSLVKWIPPLETAFSFQDWFIPVQELRAGRGSIAAERNTGCRACGCLRGCY